VLLLQEDLGSGLNAHDRSDGVEITIINGVMSPSSPWLFPSSWVPWVLFLILDLKECFRVAIWSRGFSLFGVDGSLCDVWCRLWWPETRFVGLSCGASSCEPTVG
jgi:hypothetical protein